MLYKIVPGTDSSKAFTLEDLHLIPVYKGLWPGIIRFFVSPDPPFQELIFCAFINKVVISFC